MSKGDFLSNQFLVAMPGMSDKRFERTVIYVCKHDERGAMGIAINQPLEDITVGDIMLQLEISTPDPRVGHQVVFAGGPESSQQGFIIHQNKGPWRSTLSVAGDTYLTTSSDILEAMASGNGPERVVVSLGFATWQAGQLEREIINNDWLTTPATPEVIFDAPFEHRWQLAAATLGIDIRAIAPIGHA